jgi:hypothetical protein
MSTGGRESGSAAGVHGHAPGFTASAVRPRAGLRSRWRRGAGDGVAR